MKYYFGVHNSSFFTPRSPPFLAIWVKTAGEVLHFMIKALRLAIGTAHLWRCRVQAADSRSVLNRSQIKVSENHLGAEGSKGHTCNELWVLAWLPRREP